MPIETAPGARLGRSRPCDRIGPASSPLADCSDEDLVARCREGAATAFDEIVRRHEAAMVRRCTRIVGGAAAQDAVQDAFLSAWSAIAAGAEIRALRAWLFTIAQRKAIAILRSQPRTAVELSESLADPLTADEQAAQSARARATLAALAALPDAQRDALVAVAVHGRSGRAVARELGVRECTARQLVFRARATVRAAGAACVLPPALMGRLLRRAAARTGGQIELGAAAAKAAAVALTGVAVVGAGSLHVLGAGRAEPPARAPTRLHHAAPALASPPRPAGLAGGERAPLPALRGRPPHPRSRVRGAALRSPGAHALRPTRPSQPAPGAVPASQPGATVPPSSPPIPVAGGGSADAAASPRAGGAPTVTAGGAFASPTPAGGALSQTTGTLGSVTTPTLANVSSTVGAVTSTATQTVTGATAALTQATAGAGSTVGTLTQAAGPTVGTLTQAAGSTVGTVTQVVGDAVASTTTSATQALQGLVGATGLRGLP